jgi:hypothetical protein
VVLSYVLERRGARVVGIDPGAEDESLPWFAPVRGLARDNGVPIGRFDADLVIDCDPDARPTRPEGVGLRILPPRGTPSADVNRMLLGGATDWDAIITDGGGVWETRRLESEPNDTATDVLDRATLRLVEALDAVWDTLRAGAPLAPLPRPLVAGRWRPQEAFVTWELPAETIVRRVRAAGGPWGGARTHLGDTTIWILDADVAESTPPEGEIPGTIVACDESMVVATGRGSVRIERLRPGWRPARRAGPYLRESGLGAGYLLA